MSNISRPHDVRRAALWLLFGGFRELRTKHWKWHVLRALLSVCTTFGFVYGVSRMPLVNALTLVFTEPLIVTALAVPLLGEHVGCVRYLRALAGLQRHFGRSCMYCS